MQILVSRSVNISSQNRLVGRLANHDVNIHGLCKTTDSSSLPIGLLQNTRNTSQCSVNVDETLKCMGSKKFKKLSVCTHVCPYVCEFTCKKASSVQSVALINLSILFSENV